MTVEVDLFFCYWSVNSSVTASLTLMVSLRLKIPDLLRYKAQRFNFFYSFIFPDDSSFFSFLAKSKENGGSKTKRNEFMIFDIDS